MVIDNRYSNFVQWAKIIFPLVALGLLSTMFLLSRTLDPSEAVTLAAEDVEAIAREQVVSAPRFSGVAEDGSRFTIQAKTARPDINDTDRISAEMVEATIQTPHDESYVLQADAAVFSGDSQTLDAIGAVTLETSTGYSLKTSELRADLAAFMVTAPQQISGTGPSGTIEAGQMTLRTIDDTQVLVFKDGVKLIYSP